MKQRKIVQVAVAPNDSKNQGAVFAVADDGSLWAWAGGDWDQFPPLPPIEEPEGEEKV